LKDKHYSIFFSYLKELQQCVWICRHFHSQHDGQEDITVVNVCVSVPRQKRHPILGMFTTLMGAY